MPSIIFFIPVKYVFKIPSFHEALFSCSSAETHHCFFFISVLFCVAKSECNVFRAGTLSVCFTTKTKAPAALINITTAITPLQSLNSYSPLQHNRFPVYGFCVSSGMKLGSAEFVNVTCISQELKGRSKLTS